MAPAAPCSTPEAHPFSAFFAFPEQLLAAFRTGNMTAIKLVERHSSESDNTILVVNRDLAMLLKDALTKAILDHTIRMLLA